MTHHDTYQPPLAHWDNLYTNVSEISSNNMLYHRTQTQFASTSAMSSTLGYETTETEDWGYNTLPSMAKARKIILDDDDEELGPGYDPANPFKTPIGNGIGVMMVLAMAYLLFRKVRRVRISRRIRISRD